MNDDIHGYSKVYEKLTSKNNTDNWPFYVSDHHTTNYGSHTNPSASIPKTKHEMPHSASPIIEQLKLDVKKWKTKCQLAIKNKQEIEDKYTQLLVRSEQWKGTIKAKQLDLDYIERKYKAEKQEIETKLQREIEQLKWKNEQNFKEENAKSLSQDGLIKQLQIG